MGNCMSTDQVDVVKQGGKFNNNVNNEDEAKQDGGYTYKENQYVDPLDAKTADWVYADNPNEGNPDEDGNVDENDPTEDLLKNEIDADQTNENKNEEAVNNKSESQPQEESSTSNEKTGNDSTDDCQTSEDKPNEEGKETENSKSEEQSQEELTKNDDESFVVKEGNIIEGGECPVILDSRGLGYAMYEAMKKYTDNIAEIDALTGLSQTYGSLLRACIRTAILIRRRGVRKNDVIAICSNNNRKGCIPFIASLFLGIKVSTFDPTISLPDTTYLLKLVKPKIMYLVHQSEKMMEEAVKAAGVDTKLIVFGASARNEPFTDDGVSKVEEMEFKPVVIKDLQQTAIILFSSGTTGFPKGICLSHTALMAATRAVLRTGLDIRRIMVIASLYWISSVLLLLGTAVLGNERVLVVKFQPIRAWKLIEKYKISSMMLPPTLAWIMLKVGIPENLDTSSLEHLLLGGGSVQTQLMTALRQTLPSTTVSVIYGLTESSGIGFRFRQNCEANMALSIKYPTSSGLPCNGFAYKVVDLESGENLGPGEQGELRIKSKTLMNGYHEMDSSDAFDEEGFLKTGDVAYYNEEYCFYVVDRIKEMLKYQSWHIQPAVIEEVLLGHPAVAQGIIIGIPDEVDGDHVMGVVVLKPDFKDITPEEIQGYVDERVTDRQKLRAGVKIIDAIPYTPSGKPRRRLVRDKIIRGEL